MAKRPVPAPRARLIKQVAVCSDDMRNNVKDDMESLTLQSTSQTSVESKFGAREKLHTTHAGLVTQQPQHGDFQQPLCFQPVYETNIPIPTKATPSFSGFHQHSQDIVYILEWWHSQKSWEKLKSSHTEESDETAFTKKAENLRRALYVLDYLISERGATLQGHILELQELTKGINKVHKGVKIAGITGGAAGAVGVVATVGGIILAPVTMGASLAVAAVGVGVAAAGGVTGASAAITKKVHTDMDRKKVESILKEHSTQLEEIEMCVRFIGTNIECLKKYDLSTLRGVDLKAVKMARIAHNVGDSVGTIGAVSKSSGMIQGFALGLDMYFSKEDSKKLKKSSKNKFAKKICKVVKQMQASLDELMKLKNILDSENM